MERPTCVTCAYWDQYDDDLGLCRRSAPRHPHSQVRPDCAREGMSDAIWLVTHYAEWCGEHPDFPDYLAFIRDGG